MLTVTLNVIRHVLGALASFTVLLALVLGTSIQSADAASSWSPSTNISGPGVASAALASRGGTSVAVWSRLVGADRVIEASFSASGTSWSTPTIVSGSGTNEIQPTVAIDLAGNATVAWSHTDIGAGTRETFVSTGNFGGTWSPPQALSSAGDFAQQPQIVSDDAGDLSVMWHSEIGGDSGVSFATKISGQAWSAPSNAYLGTDAVDSQTIASGKNRENLVIAWSTQSGGSQNLLVLVLIKVSTSNGPRYVPQSRMVTNLNCDRVFNIAIDAHAGNGFSLAFDCQAGADFAVTVVDYSSDETQSTPAALSLSQPWAHYPAISSDASGSQLIAWNVAAGTNSQVQARFKPHNGNWQSVTNISQPNVLGKAQVTPRGMSAFAVAWDPPTPHAELINAAVFGTSFGWSSEQVLSPASAHSTNPLLATDGHNGVITAWIATENGTSVLQSRYLPADELPDTGALPQWLWWIAAAAIGAGVFLRRMRAR